MQFDFLANIVLENQRALLRPLQPGDLENLMPPASSDPLLLQYSRAPINTPELLQQFIDESLQERKNGIRYPLVIFDKGAPAYAGSTSFAAVSNKDGRLEIGWTWFGKSFQRTGLNRNVKFLMLRYAFEALRFERVELKTDERNQQSRLAIEKIGGRFEGILRSHVLMPDGFRRNTVYYSILKSEWPAIKKDIFKNISG